MVRAERRSARGSTVPNLFQSTAARGSTVPNLFQSASARGSTVPNLFQSTAARGSTVPNLFQSTAARGSTVSNLFQSTAARGSTVPNLFQSTAARGSAVPTLVQSTAARGSTVPNLLQSVSRYSESVSRYSESVSRYSESVSRCFESAARCFESVSRKALTVAADPEKPHPPGLPLPGASDLAVLPGKRSPRPVARDAGIPLKSNAAPAPASWQAGNDGACDGYPPWPGGRRPARALGTRSTRRYPSLRNANVSSTSLSTGCSHPRSTTW